MLLELLAVLVICMAIYLMLGALAGSTLELLGCALLISGISVVFASKDPLLIGLMLLLFLKKVTHGTTRNGEFDSHGGSYPWYSP